jgi:hypothetical protein
MKTRKAPPRPSLPPASTGVHIEIWDGLCAECKTPCGPPAVEDGSARHCSFAGRLLCIQCGKRAVAEDDAEAAKPSAIADYLSRLQRWRFGRIHLDQAKDPNSGIKTTNATADAFYGLQSFLRRRSASMVLHGRKVQVDALAILRFVQHFKMEHYDEALIVAQQIATLQTDHAGLGNAETINDSDYRPPAWFAQETGIPSDRLAKAARDGRLLKVGLKKNTQYHVLGAMRLWPQDFEGLALG